MSNHCRLVGLRGLNWDSTYLLHVVSSSSRLAQAWPKWWSQGSKEQHESKTQHIGTLQGFANSVQFETVQLSKANHTVRLRVSTQRHKQTEGHSYNNLLQHLCSFILTNPPLPLSIPVILSNFSSLNGLSTIIHLSRRLSSSSTSGLLSLCFQESIKIHVQLYVTENKSNSNLNKIEFYF